MEDYIKAIFRLQEGSGRVTTQAIARRLTVAPASATNMLKRLAELQLVNYEPYRGVELTDLGQRIANEMIRHHRLLELYLTEALGFEGHEVHAEAERLEHFISEKLEERIDLALGHPTIDPHGSPIPNLKGDICQERGQTLNSFSLNTPAIVVAIPTTDSAQMAELRQKGIAPGCSVEVLGRPLRGKVHLRVDEQEVLLEAELCRWIHARYQPASSLAPEAI
jgi:DtxR family Mn-dependent transcriptional regulator